MTMLADQMKKAGVDTNAALLRSVAIDCLRKADLSPRRALTEFVDEVRDAGGMMASLHPKADTEEVGLAYLQRVAADMRGDGLRNSASADAGGHRAIAREGLGSRAPGDISAKAEGAGHGPSAGDGQITDARPTISPQGDAGQKTRAREGQDRCAGDNSAVSRGEANAEMPEVAKDCVPSPGIPRENPLLRGSAAPLGKPRGSAALRAIAAAVPSIFDNHRLSDGTKVGDLRYSQLDAVFERSARDAAIVWVIRNAGIPADRNLRVRDYLKPEQIDMTKIEGAQTAFEHAAEDISHVA